MRHSMGLESNGAPALLPVRRRLRPRLATGCVPSTDPRILECGERWRRPVPPRRSNPNQESTMSTRQHPHRVFPIALTTLALTPGEVASQLIIDAEPMEACEVLRLGGGLDVPEWLAFASAPSLMPDATGRILVRADQVAEITVLDADGGYV